MIDRNHQRVVQRLAQMGMGHANQLRQRARMTRVRLAALQPGQAHPMSGEYILRQPADPIVVILPLVLEDIGHLQALAEGNRQAHQRLALADQGRIVIKQQLSEHFTHHTRHAVAVAIQVTQGGQAMPSHVALKITHAVGHDFQAFDNRLTLRWLQSLSHLQHQRQLADQLAFGQQGRLGKQRRHLCGKPLHVDAPGNGIDEAILVAKLLLGGQRGLVLDGVGDTTQQVGVGHCTAQVRRQLGDGQGKGSGDFREDGVLVRVGSVAGLGGQS